MQGQYVLDIMAELIAAADKGRTEGRGGGMYLVQNGLSVAICVYDVIRLSSIVSAHHVMSDTSE